MKLSGQLFCIISFLIFSFVYLRSLIYGIKRYQLNKSALKKRQKGETFIEWFLYTRYKNEIPKIILFFYFSVLIVHFASIVVCIILHFTVASSSMIGKRIALVIIYTDPLWMLLLHLMFWTNKPWEAHVYARWITKRKGQPPKKKKKWPRK